MKLSCRTIAIATCLALGTSAYSYDSFLRPEVSYNFASANDPVVKLKDTVGYSILGGVYYGAQNEHEGALSVGVVDFNIKPVVVSGVTVTGKVKTVPLMASYRYYIGAKTDPVRVYLGASAGYTFLKASFTGTLAGFTASNSASETDFTWGGGAGILFKVAERTDIDVGYRYQAIQMSDGHMDVSSVYAGVNFLF